MKENGFAKVMIICIAIIVLHTKKDEKCIKNFHRLTKVNGIQDYLGTHYLQTYLLETRNIDPRLNDDLILI